VQSIISTGTRLQFLYCYKCNNQFNYQQIQSYATCCNVPLLAQYNLTPISKNILKHRPHTIWRYKEFLPLIDSQNIVSLGEGYTTIHHLEKLSKTINCRKILLKDEGENPTGSFKARGLSVAISKAKELGIEHCIIPTAGNAGGALSAYAAKANIKATVIMPKHTSNTLKDECKLYGAELIEVDGLIDACGKLAKTIAAQTGAFDMSTMKEPYRIEGKKTLGYEIAEQLNWQLPDVIIYPTGGGTGLIGMWKAFKEMINLGWITNKLPKMIIVQTENCNPMIQEFENGKVTASFSPRATIASGLAVPYPFANELIQSVVRESNGTAVTVSESEMINGVDVVARLEGLILSPEGSASFMGLKKLIEKDYIKEDETVLLFNTGSWYKYR
jgi:threonine synthase